MWSPCHPPVPVFIFQFCDVAQVVNIHIKICRAKFGNIQNMKVDISSALFHVVGNCGEFW
jgi:hypothetical protein